MVRPAKYVDLKVPALRDVCVERGLDNTGLRRDLIARLQRKDRLNENTEVEVRLRDREEGVGGVGRYRGPAFGGGHQRSETREGDGRGLERKADDGQRGIDAWGMILSHHGQYSGKHAQVYDQVREREYPPGPFQRHDGIDSPQHRPEQHGTDDPPSASRHNQMSAAPALPHRQLSDLNLHPRDDPAVMHLSEEQLADILFANCTPFEPDRNGYDRRAKIRAEHDVKLDEARKKKDSAIARALTKYNTEVDKLKVEREGKYCDLESDLSARREKDQRWNPAFARLKGLREARGLQTRPRDFAVRARSSDINHQIQRYYPSSQLSPPISRRPVSPPRALMPLASAPTLKRKPTSPRAQYQSYERDTSTASTHSLGPNAKRSCSDTSRYFPPLSSTSKDNRPPEFFTPLSKISPATQQQTSPISLVPAITHLPYIFLPASNNMTFTDVKALLAECPHTYAKTSDIEIKADETGYFMTFEDGERGEEMAVRFHNFFDGQRMDGTPVIMELHKRERLVGE
ncbi:hypothetical protein ONS95_012341 [Cadophora gregata]|uniref:uncharacterized protein n=1 Tax=Cadophora gregata TaxID=51156 RepID=UPI0026DB51F5|nr:uncharacterized protein ONS95_012341 [Cadophora gregata]KAK0118031.1 hypothetical protein ONS95_012341 [Cadophora gregata]KAK0123098.1 hypothetical protein ONS96_010104 [Cadophora gregata f. sp. sojae]